MRHRCHRAVSLTFAAALLVACGASPELEPVLDPSHHAEEGDYAEEGAEPSERAFDDGAVIQHPLASPACAVGSPSVRHRARQSQYQSAESFDARFCTRPMRDDVYR